MANRKNAGANAASEAGDAQAPRWLCRLLTRRAKNLLAYVRAEVREAYWLCMTQGVTPADAGEEVQEIFLLGEHLGMAPPDQRRKVARGKG